MTSQPFTTCVGGSARRRLSAPFPCAGSLEQLGQFAHDKLALAAMANGLCANSLERSRPATQTDVRAPPARPDTASLRAASHPTLPTYHEAPSSIACGSAVAAASESSTTQAPFASGTGRRAQLRAIRSARRSNRPPAAA